MPPPFCISLSLQSKEITFQLQEDLMKVLNELYTVSVVNFVAVKVIFLAFHSRILLVRVASGYTQECTMVKHP